MNDYRALEQHERQQGQYDCILWFQWGEVDHFTHPEEIQMSMEGTKSAQVGLQKCSHFKTQYTFCQNIKCIAKFMQGNHLSSFTVTETSSIQKNADVKV